MSHHLQAIAASGLLASVAVLTGCTDGRAVPSYSIAASGDATHGRLVIEAYGCGSCHTIPGVHAANGLVGPPLLYFSRRTMIAGELPNSPENLVRWIEDPRSVEPGTAMPRLGLTDAEAHDAAAYLYTLR
jgi:cytochrome c1